MNSKEIRVNSTDNVQNPIRKDSKWDFSSNSTGVDKQPGKQTAVKFKLDKFLGKDQLALLSEKAEGQLQVLQDSFQCHVLNYDSAMTLGSCRNNKAGYTILFVLCKGCTAKTLEEFLW